MREWVFKKSDPYHWTLYHWRREYFVFDDFSDRITKETNVQDVIDAVDTGIEIMYDELNIEFDMEDIDFLRIQDCIFSAVCNEFNIH